MNRPTKLVCFGLVAALTACGDAVGPRGESADALNEPNVVGGVASASLSAADTLRFSITIDPAKRSTFYLGAGNSLVFPTNAVCDPTRTKYGEGFWDKPCEASKIPVTVAVKAWLDKTGHPRADFSPNIRFVPSDLPTRWVKITFADQAAALSPEFNILYAPDVHAAGHDEAKLDASLATVRDPVTGQLSRRIKHFSGYLVGAGDDSTPVMNLVPRTSPMPSASMVPSSTPVKRVSYKASVSGYILVSG